MTSNGPTMLVEHYEQNMHFRGHKYGYYNISDSLSMLRMIKFFTDVTVPVFLLSPIPRF